MPSPYSDLPDHAFWKRTMAGRAAEALDFPADPSVRIGAEEPIATAGSCFAQHVSRSIQERGFHYLVTEQAPEGATAAQSYGVYPARFGNIYAPRQLLQTFDRAYGLFEPLDGAWRRPDGRLVDPFRPQVEPAGFGSIESLEKDRVRHLAAVREMFETCAVFIFTLGLTEAWRSTRDGAVYPLAPGVVAAEPGPDYEFHNFSTAEVTADLTAFLDKLEAVNPGVRVILTVSPVPLLATYGDAHVLTATAYSKAVLRVSAQEAADGRARTSYFPSFEIITGPQARGRFFEDDLRSVTPEGVALAMDLFARRYLADEPTPQKPATEQVATVLAASDVARLNELADVICDEEAIDP